MLDILCSRHPERRFHLTGDSTYSGKSVVRPLPATCQMTGRLPMDAALWTRPPKPQAFYSTVTDATPEQALTWYARRWAVEVTFQEAKGHLGFEEPQGWTRRAVERTAPVAMFL